METTPLKRWDRGYVVGYTPATHAKEKVIIYSRSAGQADRERYIAKKVALYRDYEVKMAHYDMIEHVLENSETYPTLAAKYRATKYEAMSAAVVAYKAYKEFCQKNGETL